MAAICYKYINVAVWNIQGLFTSINRAKTCKLDDPEFLGYLRSLDILCLQEIQSGPIETQSLAVDGFRIISFHRKKSANNRYFGGTMLLIKNELMRGIKIIDNCGGDIIWVKLAKDFFGLEKDILICFAYVPPTNSPYTKGLDYDLMDKIEEDIARYKTDGSIILAGDLNAKKQYCK